MFYISRTPRDPEWVFHAGHQGNLRNRLFNLRIKGKYAYAHGRHNYMHVFDISRPDQPYLVKSYGMGTCPPILLFRAKGEKVELIHQRTKDSLDSSADFVRFFASVFRFATGRTVPRPCKPTFRLGGLA